MFVWLPFFLSFPSSTSYRLLILPFFTTHYFSPLVSSPFFSQVFPFFPHLSRLSVAHLLNMGRSSGVSSSLSSLSRLRIHLSFSSLFSGVYRCVLSSSLSCLHHRHQFLFFFVWPVKNLVFHTWWIWLGCNLIGLIGTGYWHTHTFLQDSIYQVHNIL